MRRGLVVFAPPSRVAVAVAVLLGFAALVNCSDGTTADCSDAATPCGPRFPDGGAREGGSDDGSPADASDDVDDAGLPDAPDAD